MRRSLVFILIVAVVIYSYWDYARFVIALISLILGFSMFKKIAALISRWRSNCSVCGVGSMSGEIFIDSLF